MKKAVSIILCTLCTVTAFFIAVALILEYIGYNIGIIGIQLSPCIPYIALVFICCASFLIKIHVKNEFVKISAGILSILLICILCILSFFHLIFPPFGKDKAVKTVDSPNGEYYAEVIDSDQGALGGSTFVDVYEKSIIKTPVLTVSKKPKRIYTGKWGEYKGMQIYWKDDTCLVINLTEYEIE